MWSPRAGIEKGVLPLSPRKTPSSQSLERKVFKKEYAKMKWTPRCEEGNRELEKLVVLSSEFGRRGEIVSNGASKGLSQFLNVLRKGTSANSRIAPLLPSETRTICQKLSDRV